MTELLGAYFAAAHFWRDIAYVMALTIDDLAEHVDQAQRITAAASRQ